MKKLPHIPVIFSILFVTILLVLSFWFKIITIRAGDSNVITNPVHPKRDVRSATISAWVKGSQDLTPIPASSNSSLSNIPTGKAGEMTVSCVIDARCGGGEKVLPLSVCENSACCLQGGKYVQYWNRKYCGVTVTDTSQKANQTKSSDAYPVYTDNYTNPIVNYETFYLKTLGTSYSCLASKISELSEAEQSYIDEVQEVSQICAVNDATTYEDCAQRCVGGSNFDACEQACYAQIDWACSVDTTHSPEFVNLSRLLSLYCK